MPEVNRLEYDKFLLLVDTAIEETEKNIMPNNISNNEEIKNTTGEIPEITGEKPSNSMITIKKENQFLRIFSNAAVCSREYNINPTTVRQRASEKKVDSDGNTWGYINQEQYNNLKNK